MREYWESFLENKSWSAHQKVSFVCSQPRPTAELDRSGDHVYTGVMAMVKQVVQLKNDIHVLPASEYPNSVKVSPPPRVVAYFSRLCTKGWHRLSISYSLWQEKSHSDRLTWCQTVTPDKLTISFYIKISGIWIVLKVVIWKFSIKSHNATSDAMFGVVMVWPMCYWPT